MPIDAQVKPPVEYKPKPRELQVLQLICQGHSSKQIAGLRGVSFKTAACHRMRLMEKAGVHDAISLFRWALSQATSHLAMHRKLIEEEALLWW
jgi:DNA-binding NarL/FixJ family response regulator